MKIWKPETSSDLVSPSVNNQDTKRVVGPQDPITPLSPSQTQHMNRGHSPVHSPVARLRGDTECDTPGSPRGGQGRGELPHGGLETLAAWKAGPAPPSHPCLLQGPVLATPGVSERDGTQAQAGRRWAVRGPRVDANARRSAPGALRPGDHCRLSQGSHLPCPRAKAGDGRVGTRGVEGAPGTPSLRSCGREHMGLSEPLVQCCHPCVTSWHSGP